LAQRARLAGLKMVGTSVCKRRKELPHLAGNAATCPFPLLKDVAIIFRPARFPRSAGDFPDSSQQCWTAQKA
jgi:hypothetical protein